MNHPVIVPPVPDIADRNHAARVLALTRALRWALPVSPHEGYAKILERLDDLKAEVFHGSRARAREDAVWVAAAAMSLLFALDKHVIVECVAIEVTAELERAQRLFGPYVSPHEGYAVILEELDELWIEVKKGDRVAAWTEAVQVAAVALRFHVDIADEPEEVNERGDENG